jgi:dTDP-4-amino-4,6-dideoxygalactose transaminase
LDLIYEIERTLAGKFRRDHCVLTGSGTTAIYLILRALNLEQGDAVLMPGTCCFSPAYAIKYAGLKLDFCDISLKDGCMSPKDLVSAIVENPSIRVVIGVHLYGNVMDLDPIRRICGEREIVFIEDVCQAYGSGYKGFPCGSFGDFAVLSFGHTKILDAGGTGAVLTDKHELAETIRKEMEPIPDYDPTLMKSMSKRHSEEYYRIQKISRHDPQEKILFEKLPEKYKELFIQSINFKVLPTLKSLIEKESSITQHRIKLASLYKDLLSNCPKIEILESENGAVPWRFSCLIKDINTGSLCDEIRKKGFDISAWYPNLASMFVHDYSRALRNANILEETIINLWIDETRDESYVQKVSATLRDSILSKQTVNSKGDS